MDGVVPFLFSPFSLLVSAIIYIPATKAILYLQCVIPASNPLNDVERMLSVCYVDFLADALLAVATGAYRSVR
ncbi:hypothetical protein [Serratia fonticola]|jgi:hypothetical protein|uniref:hypothetical protein n=1 Tax=Serratia fonticola TaxID=47917 RepID=UPI001419FD02|nr:hypothetical protein [Serratia fonticola]NXZ88863.1 hypothetical protein [Serratia fonticola]